VGAENGKVDVNDERRIVPGRRSAVASREHKIMHARARFTTDRLARPLRAARFVVVTVNVVDRVMEPERKVNFGRVCGKRARFVKLLETFFQMPQCVVAAMRLAIGAH
jgi:hypothetical protein